MPTNLDTRAEILAELWMNYRDDSQFADFIDYNDLGLPLAYASANKIVKLTNQGESLLNETFDLLLSALDIPEDEGYESLEDLFSI